MLFSCEKPDESVDSPNRQFPGASHSKPWPLTVTMLPPWNSPAVGNNELTRRAV